MMEVTYYVADDSKEFSDEYECQVYEFGLLTKNAKFKLYDKDKKPLPIGDVQSYEDCYYFYLPDEASVEKFKECWNNEIIEFYPPTIRDFNEYFPGFFQFDESTDEWFNIDFELRQLEETLRQLKQE